MGRVRVYKILKSSKVEGPGIRYCIWFQGCSRHCKGCFAKATWSHTEGIELDMDDILNDISLQKNIEGVTFLGGEPFEQPEALKYLTEKIKSKGLSILCFTGNRLEDLKELYPEILTNIDILIDGEFVDSQKDYSRPWVGSWNQRYHFLTNRYNESILNNYKNKIEINIQKNGVMFINGMGNFEKFVSNLDNMLTLH